LNVYPHKVIQECIIYLLTIYVLPQTLRFLYIVGAKDKQIIDILYIKKKL
jgi:hypothetical protein